MIERLNTNRCGYFSFEYDLACKINEIIDHLGQGNLPKSGRQHSGGRETEARDGDVTVDGGSKLKVLKCRWVSSSTDMCSGVTTIYYRDLTQPEVNSGEQMATGCS